jgi:HYR domain
MRNFRKTPRRKLRLLLLSAVLLAVGAGVLFAAVRADADSVGTLQVHGTFRANFSSVGCPAGIPAATSYCFSDVSVRADLFPGVGEVTTAYIVVHDGFGSACEHVHAQIPIFVAGKGEIDLAMRSTGCIDPNQPGLFGPTEVTVTGGSGRYTRASGSGGLNYKNDLAGPGSGVAIVTWTGTLNVAGLAFDTTPPQIAGATSKTAKTRTAKGTRVRYSVSAADVTDGPVPASCLPKSGRVFRVGRTTVTCNAVDGSANTATAHFVITVKRVRR